MRTIGYLAAALSLCAGSSALAVWGLKYEVNAGGGWTDAATIDVSSGAVTVDFRITVYHDGSTLVNGAWGSLTALAPLRLCNSQIITNFGDASFGDSLLSYKVSVDSVNPKALVHSQSGADMVLGTANSVYSFASNTAIVIPHPQQLEVQFYAGKMLIGNGGLGATSRTITLTANSFGFPGADSGTGGPFGASFFVVRNGSNGHGVVTSASTTLPATITVQLPCPADLNGDRLVGDADFTMFAQALDLLDCSNSSMTAGCPADLNGDGVVDESDFVVFVGAYDVLVCP
ncbi:MAG: dockerin type I domain-containing protein [Phycisphaerales bacterium]